jgi:hypothetical protein
MRKRGYRLSEQADALRESGDLTGAGNAYTAAAYEFAGTVTDHTFPECDKTATAISNICFAAICYRIVGDQFRVQNRCDVGILLAEDYINHIEGEKFEDGSFADLRRGAWPEYIGDCRMIADREGADMAYDRAIEIYRSAGDIDFVYGEREHNYLTKLFTNIKRGAGYEISEDAPERQPLGGPTFTEWVRYKRKHLPGFLEDLDKKGAWPVD